MNRSLVMVVSLLAAVNGWALGLGETIPAADTKMKNVDGKEVSIADVKGEKGTLVVFSCNHCPFAKAWEGRIAALGNEYRKKGIGVIQINSNDPAKAKDDGYEGMQARAKERGFEFPYVVDANSAVAVAFGATRTPEVYLFDAKGKLAYHGTIDDNDKKPDQVEKHYLRDALAAQVEGKEIKDKETKAVGCTIKFHAKS